jgi:hypothetical protein
MKIVILYDGKITEVTYSHVCSSLLSLSLQAIGTMGRTEVRISGEGTALYTAQMALRSRLRVQV